MRSDAGPEPTSPSPAAVDDPDRTARARIRDAAIERFAADGVDATSVRAIAAAAGVSPGLVIHHFGSKDALRVACDQHVARLVHQRKAEQVAQGPSFDVLAAFRESDGPPLLRYLARTLADGSPHVTDLVAEMVADAERTLAVAVETGVAQPSSHPRERAAVLTLWSLGALVLHEQVRAVLGDDLLEASTVPHSYLRGATDILGRGVLSEALAAQLEAALDQPPGDTGTAPSTEG